MSSISVIQNSEIFRNNNFSAFYGSYNSDLSPIDVIDVSDTVLNMIVNELLTIPKEYFLNKPYKIPGNNKFLIINYNDRNYFIAEDKYSDDIKIFLGGAKKELVIVYNVFIEPKANWQGIIAGQLLQLRSYGILPEADLYVHITDSYNLADDVKRIILNIVPKANISVSTVNEFEYPGLKRLHDLSKIDNERKFIYFHSKGMSHGHFTRSLDDITLMLTTFKGWRKHCQHLGKDGIDKIGLLPAFGDENPGGNLGKKGGWIWYNFWYATGTYLSNCPDPLLTSNRYYYEEWLGWRNGESLPVVRQDTKAIYNIKVISKTFYSSLEAQYYLSRLVYKHNYNQISKELPYIIRSSLTLYLYLMIKKLLRRK